MATELLPDFADQFRRVKDDGRAEAALIARYGAYRRTSSQAVTGVDEDEDDDERWIRRQRCPICGGLAVHVTRSTRNGGAKAAGNVITELTS